MGLTSIILPTICRKKFRCSCFPDVHRRSFYKKHRNYTHLTSFSTFGNLFRRTCFSYWLWSVVILANWLSSVVNLAEKVVDICKSRKYHFYFVKAYMCFYRNLVFCAKFPVSNIILGRRLFGSYIFRNGTNRTQVKHGWESHSINDIISLIVTRFEKKLLSCKLNIKIVRNFWCYLLLTFFRDIHYLKL